MKTWTFFTNHAHVLFALATRPEQTVREIAQEVGITERATQKILADLVADDYLDVSKSGRQNVYNVNTERHLKHDIERNCTIGQLVDIISDARQLD